MDWNVTSVGKPIPASYTTQVAKDTVLVDIMKKAAYENWVYNWWTSTYYGGLGHLISSMNDVEQVCVEHMNSPRCNSCIFDEAARENLVFSEMISSR